MREIWINDTAPDNLFEVSRFALDGRLFGVYLYVAEKRRMKHGKQNGGHKTGLTAQSKHQGAGVNGIYAIVVPWNDGFYGGVYGATSLG